MDEHLSKGEFLAHIEPIKKDIAQLVQFQRDQNGRVGKAETRIAVLEERTPPSRIESNTISAVISGVISGLGIWIGSQK